MPGCIMSLSLFDICMIDSMLLSLIGAGGIASAFGVLRLFVVHLKALDTFLRKVVHGVE